MKNSPAFQFYPQDFLSDLNVREMTMEEVGIYTLALCHCWIEDGLPNGSTVVEGWFNQHPTVARCFVQIDGKFRNKRLDEEAEKQARWREKSARGGKKSGVIRGKTKGGSRVVEPKGNSSSSSSSSSSIIKEDKNLPFYPLAELLRGRVAENVPFQKINQNYRKAWANTFRLMVEADNVPPDKLHAVLEWATNDSFWKLQIRSADNFREKFGQLEAKSRMVNPSDLRQAEVQRERRVGKAQDLDAERQKKIDAVADRIYRKEYGPKLEAARVKGEYQKYKAEADEAFRVETGKIMRGEV